MAKILLVEDDNNLREIYGERLMAEGYDIVSASDGEEALQTAVNEKPDLIISDVMMPKISGFDMLDILRQTPETKNVKIIMMTALSQAEDKTRADKLGADKYLVKSQVTLEDVARVVHDILNDSDEPSDTNEQAQPVLEALTPIVSELPTPIATEPGLASEPAVAPLSVATAPVSEPAVPAPEPVVVTEPVVAPQPVVSPEPVVAAPVAPVPEPVAVPTAAPEPVVPAPEPILAPEPIITPAPEPVVVTEPVVAPQPVVSPEPVVAAPVAPVPEPVAVPTAAPEPVSVPSTNPVSDTPAYNPIAASLTDPAASDPNSSAVVAGGNLGSESVADEMAEVQHQIEEFVANNSAQIAEHQEPVNEPTEQDIIHAENAQDAPPVLSSAPQVDPTIPPIIQSQLDATRNPEPAQARKKIIEPVSGDGGLNTPDIHALYEEEMAKEAAITTNNNPVGGTVIENQESVSNPIASQEEVAPPPLETIDVSDITGMSDPEEAAAEAILQQAAQGIQVSTTDQQVQPPAPDLTQAPPLNEAAPTQTTETEKPLDPNDPNNFAL
jgi:CheY-like chemotaxis protein